VEIACNKENKKSLRVMEKCGFKYEGEAKNYFLEPAPEMLKNGYHPERTGLQYALVKGAIQNLHWFEEVKKQIVG
jgi:RimJ/RimL family protein N-acetyltransferase